MPKPAERALRILHTQSARRRRKSSAAAPVPDTPAMSAVAESMSAMPLSALGMRNGGGVDGARTTATVRTAGVKATISTPRLCTHGKEGGAHGVNGVCKCMELEQSVHSV